MPELEAVTAPRVRAAQYLRMSSEHQRYSLANQTQAIAQYAVARGYKIVKTYSDAARSGLTLKGRAALKQLLADAVTGSQDFDVVLILDVSRWGRYQNPDQAAHYEFLCNEAGLSLCYCAEPFENDGSPAAAMVKHMKRIMAGEFSRELSIRIRRAKLHQAHIGNQAALRAVFGVRRLVVSDDGSPKRLLQLGENAALSDRIAIVPGPDDEVETVRRIFHLFSNLSRGHEEIARVLKAEGRPHPRNGPWTGARVRSVLTREAYCGRLFYGKTYQYLRANQTKMPRQSWVRLPDMEPIISPRLFTRARAILDNRPVSLSDDELLARLAACLEKHGRLSQRIIRDCDELPHSSTVISRFGSLRAAYERIGYDLDAVRRSHQKRSDAYIFVRLREIHAKHGYITARLVSAETDLPNASTFINRFGGITRAYALAGLDVPLTRSAIAKAAAHRAGRGTCGRAPRICPPRKIPILRGADGARFTNDELVALLKRVLIERGFLSERLIQEAPDLPTASLYRFRFGNLCNAYAAAGYFSTRSGVLLAALARARHAVSASELNLV